ncbi:MAG: fibronectin type III domain-containing protein, partial [Methanomicrobiales archaeon]|nr:fibronectin type III domain-containing protein [Methanomicrobiales archaeon]
EKHFPVSLFACLSLLALAGALCHSAHAASSVPIIGVIPLVAFNISVSSIHDTGATITWNTNALSNSTVEYGPTTGYGAVRRDPVPEMNHTIVLDGLTPGTVYHFRVESADSFNRVCRGPDGQFSTTGAAPTPGGRGSGGGGGAYVGVVLSFCRATPGGVITPVTGKGMLSSCTIISSANTMTDLRSSWSANILEDPPAGARFITYIRSQLTDSQRSAFDAALASQGLQMADLAYVMEVVESPPLETGVENIQMDVPRSWVTEHGGVGAVRIIGFGDDGLARILETRFSNYALDTGHMNFRASAYSDASLYALVAVKTTPVPPLVTPTAVPTTVVPTGTVTGAGPGPVPSSWIPLATVSLAILAIVIGMILWMRKKGR